MGEPSEGERGSRNRFSAAIRRAIRIAITAGDVAVVDEAGCLRTFKDVPKNSSAAWNARW
jgi:hypothetical protein